MTITIINADWAYAIEAPADYDPSLVTEEDALHDGQIRTIDAPLKGGDALEYARAHPDVRLSSYTSPIAEACDELTLDEAEEIAREDAGLLYLSV
jgi:hypothetical protein